MSNPSTLGELIRERRLARGLSLGQLATAVGRTAATVRSWERDQHAPAPDVVDRLAEALRIDMSELDAFLFVDPPSLTVVGEDDDEVSEETSVSGEASIETAEGAGDDDTAEAGEVESAPAAAAADDGKASMIASAADELGVMPRIARPPGDEDSAVEFESPQATHGSPDLPEAPGDEVVGDDPDQGDPAAAPVAGDEDEELVTVSMAPADPVAAPTQAAQEVEYDLADEPTEAIGPPVAPIAPETGHAGVAVRAEMLSEPTLPPFLAPLRSVFDPHKKWLYWIRGSLTVVTMLVLLLVLAWAAGELFDGLGAVLDTIESTDSVASDLAPSG